MRLVNMVGGVIVHCTSYFRYMSEPDVVSPEEADIKTMEMLGVSKLNPDYLIAKVKQYFFRRE